MPYGTPPFYLIANPDSQSWSLNLIAEQRHLFAFIPVYLA
jgi:hypothetical protein